MRFISFTSGSCGNCYWIGPDKGPGGILVDAGASMRSVKRSLLDRGLSLDDVTAVLVTHDHLDHIRYLGTYCKYRMPKVFTTRKLHVALSAHTFTKDHIAPCRNILVADKWNGVGPFEVRFFEVPHDATQTVGYAIRENGHMLVLMTDLEHVTDEAMDLARQADTVVIESNYDRKMLLEGPYPPELKKRILDEGHLCNDACAAAIKEFWHEGLKNIFLCHLSGNNNTPQQAFNCAAAALAEIGVEQGTVSLRTLARGVPGPVIQL